MLPKEIKYLQEEQEQDPAAKQAAAEAHAKAQAEAAKTADEAAAEAHAKADEAAAVAAQGQEPPPPPPDPKVALLAALHQAKSGVTTAKRQLMLDHLADSVHSVIEALIEFHKPAPAAAEQQHEATGA